VVSVRSRMPPGGGGDSHERQHRLHGSAKGAPRRAACWKGLTLTLSAPRHGIAPSSLLGSLPFLAALSLVLGGCSGSDGPAPLTQVALPAWDGGADAGCTLAPTAVAMECGSAYRIGGDPYVCPGFDDAGTGATIRCEAVCQSKDCHLSGLSDDTSAVVCGAGCSALGEH